MHHRSRRFAGSRRSLGLVAAFGLALAACSDPGTTPQDPNLPGDPGGNPQFRKAAFIVDVNTSTKEIRISAPSLNMAPGIETSAPEGGLLGSILGADVISLTADDYESTTMGGSSAQCGAAPAGK